MVTPLPRTVRASSKVTVGCRTIRTIIRRARRLSTRLSLNGPVDVCAYLTTVYHWLGIDNSYLSLAYARPRDQKVFTVRMQPRLHLSYWLVALT